MQKIKDFVAIMFPLGLCVSCALVPGLGGATHGQTAQEETTQEPVIPSDPFDAELLEAARTSITALGAYTGSNPDSAEALALIAALENPVENAREFLAAFPNSKKRIDLEKTWSDHQWQSAGGWKAYLEAHPKGFYARKAELLREGEKTLDVHNADAKRLASAQKIFDTDPTLVRAQYKAVLVISDTIYFHPKRRTPFYLGGILSHGMAYLQWTTSTDTKLSERACTLFKEKIPNVNTCVTFGSGLPSVSYDTRGISLPTFTAVVTNAAFGGLVENGVPVDAIRMFELTDFAMNNGGAYSEYQTYEALASLFESMRFSKMREYWGGSDSKRIDGHVTRLDLKNSLLWRTPRKSTDTKHSGAAKVCAAYEYGGLSEWRLPTSGEYLALRDKDACPPESKEPPQKVAWGDERGRPRFGCRATFHERMVQYVAGSGSFWLNDGRKYKWTSVKHSLFVESSGDVSGIPRYTDINAKVNCVHAMPPREEPPIKEEPPVEEETDSTSTPATPSNDSTNPE